MTLLLAYGNPGRGDDGLGPAFAERIDRCGLPELEILVDYQLKVEHAVRIAPARRVVFADAAIGQTKPFRFTRLVPTPSGDVTSHALSPDTLMTLVDTLYGPAPPAYVLSISGSEFGRIHEGLSRSAQQNLEQAASGFLDWIDESEHSDGGSVNRFQFCP